MDTIILLESLRIAMREMRRHRTRSVLTMLGVIFGVAAIIAVVSISQGAKRQIQAQISNLGSNMIIVLPESSTQGGIRAGTGTAATLTMQDAEALDELSLVAYAAPATRSIQLAVSEWANWSVEVIGTTDQYADVRSWPIESGRNLERRDVESAAKVAVLGQTTAKQLFGQIDPVGERIRIKGTPFTIVGVLATKGQSPIGKDLDDTILVPVTTDFTYLSSNNRPNAIIASAVSEKTIPEAIEQIRVLLRQRHQIREGDIDDFTAKSLEEAAKTAEDTSNVMTTLLVSIAAISLLVGGIGIMNIMLVTVMERTREIGVRMALGASRRMIMTQFLIEAVTIAAVGGLLGVALGLVGSDVISRFSGWPAIYGPSLLFLPLLFALGVGILFGLLPARRASRLSPVESLRHE